MKPRILVPFDFSPEAERALAWAGELQQATDGELHLLHVSTSLPPAGFDLPVPISISEAERIRLEGQLERLLKGRGLAGTARVVVAPACGPTILEEAASLRADLIAMGTRGRGGLRRFALGSVADHVVRHADCPVVTVRAHPEHERQRGHETPAALSPADRAGDRQA